jgi:hypothetical protein
MLGKSGKPLSPEYAARLRRAEAKGITDRQKARGHKAKEHIPRRERELAEGETTYQRGEIKKFALKQWERMDDVSREATDPEAVIAVFQRRFKKRFAEFLEAKAEINKLHALKRLRPEGHRGKRRGVPTHRAIDLGAAIERAEAQRRRNIARQHAWARKYKIDVAFANYH